MASYFGKRVFRRQVVIRLQQVHASLSSTTATVQVCISTLSLPGSQTKF